MVCVGPGGGALGPGCWVRASGGIGAWGPGHGDQCMGARRVVVPLPRLPRALEFAESEAGRGMWDDAGFS